MENEDLRVDIKFVDSGQIKAFADLTVMCSHGEITINGFRVIQGEGQSPWVALPTSTYTQNGAVKRKQLLDVTRKTRQRLAEEILRKFEEQGRGT